MIKITPEPWLFWWANCRQNVRDTVTTAVGILDLRMQFPVEGAFYVLICRLAQSEQISVETRKSEHRPNGDNIDQT